jgi:hypothetical protein
VHVGDIDPAEAGSASGSLSSVQQLANAIGPAVITTIYFGALAGGPAHAMTLSLLTVIAIGVLSCPAIPLLPRHARQLRDGDWYGLAGDRVRGGKCLEDGQQPVP